MYFFMKVQCCVKKKERNYSLYSFQFMYEVSRGDPLSPLSSLGCPSRLWLRLVLHGRVRQQIPACHAYLVVHLCRDGFQSKMAETGLKKKMQSHFLYNLYKENVLNLINLLLLFNLITELLPERISC